MSSATINFFWGGVEESSNLQWILSFMLSIRKHTKEFVEVSELKYHWCCVWICYAKSGDDIYHQPPNFSYHHYFVVEWKMKLLYIFQTISMKINNWIYTTEHGGNHCLAGCRPHSQPVQYLDPRCALSDVSVIVCLDWRCTKLYNRYCTLFLFFNNLKGGGFIQTQQTPPGYGPVYMFNLHIPIMS